MAGFSSLTGGGGLSSSASSKSGDARSGDVGIQVGGINTGTQSTIPGYVWIAALAIAALFLLRRR